MTIGERFQEILDELPAGWSEAQLVVSIADESALARATLILASLAPGRSGSTFRIRMVAGGTGGPSIDAVRRTLERLEREGIDARLAEPAASDVRLEPLTAGNGAHRRALADTWDELQSTFPPDWSDAYLEVELVSTDDIDRAALLLAPANPFLVERGRPAFRFRSAHRFGYGAAPVMTRRVLARLDEERIAGSLRLLHLRSDIHPVLTQGPVWREDGRAI